MGGKKTYRDVRFFHSALQLFLTIILRVDSYVIYTIYVTICRLLQYQVVCIQLSGEVDSF